VKTGSADGKMRVDLHLHSRASGSATNVWVKGLGDEVGVRESYTPPTGVMVWAVLFYGFFSAALVLSFLEE
jgi:hypothetical protein